MTISSQPLFCAKFLLAKVINSNMVGLSFLVHRETFLVISKLCLLIFMHGFGSQGYCVELIEHNF